MILYTVVIESHSLQLILLFENLQSDESSDNSNNVQVAATTEMHSTSSQRNAKIMVISLF